MDGLQDVGVFVSLVRLWEYSFKQLVLVTGLGIAVVILGLHVRDAEVLTSNPW